MSLQTALVAVKTANSTLNTLVGTRFHPDKLPQKTQGQTWAQYLPIVRFQVISRTRSYPFGRRASLSHARVQLDGYAATEAARTTLRAALISAFLPTTRVSGSYGGETLQDIRFDNEREGVDMLDTDTAAYRISIDTIVDLVEA